MKKHPDLLHEEKNSLNVRAAENVPLLEGGENTVGPTGAVYEEKNCLNETQEISCFGLLQSIFQFVLFRYLTQQNRNVLNKLILVFFMKVL